MKISTKGLYGLRALVDLAFYYDQQPVTLKQIAERQDISEAYLEQIFAILRKGEIVKSVKGPQGGYIVEKPLEEISIGNILALLEGSLLKYDAPIKDNIVDRVIHEQVWDVLNQNIREVIMNKTLDMLVDETKQLKNQQVQMYYI